MARSSSVNFKLFAKEMRTLLRSLSWRRLPKRDQGFDALQTGEKAMPCQAVNRDQPFLGDAKLKLKLIEYFKLPASTMVDKLTSKPCLRRFRRLVATDLSAVLNDCCSLSPPSAVLGPDQTRKWFTNKITINPLAINQNPPILVSMAKNMLQYHHRILKFPSISYWRWFSHY